MNNYHGLVVYRLQQDPVFLSIDSWDRVYPDIALYICSSNSNRINWWGKVNLEKDNNRSALFNTASSKPKEPPIMKSIHLFSLKPRSFSFSEKTWVDKA